MQVIQDNRRVVLLVLVVVVMLCLLGVLASNIYFRDDGTDVAKPPSPTPTAEPTDEGPDVVITPEDGQTPTPTRVIEEEPEPEATEEEAAPEEDSEEEDSAEESSPEPTVEPTTEPEPTSTAADFAGVPSTVTVFQIDNILDDGDFEAGFDEDTGVGLNWENFKTGAAIISFSEETAEPFVKTGASAQRISVQTATETDRYAGIYKTVEVVPGESYTLTIHGQVRTAYGDVNDSGYGYRVQYAIDNDGGEDWQAITQAAWVELPWGEQLLHTSDVSFSEFTGQIIPESDEITLFIRTWNKWADPKLVEYTLDNISLVGPAGTVIIAGTETAATETTDEEMIDQPLPMTGTGDAADFMQDGRFWGALLVLLLLGVGAVYRAKWRW